MLKKLSSLALFATLTILPASAAVLADYDFAGDSRASSDTDLMTEAADLVNGPFTGGTGSPNVTGNQLVITTNMTGTGTGDSDTLAKSIALGNYVSFTLDNLGNTVSFTGFSFDQSLFNGNPTSVSASVFSSVGGFADAADSLGTFNIDAAGDAGPFNRSLDLSGVAELQNVSANTEWRIYFFDNSDTGARSQNIDNIILQGTVVPEPASASLLLGATGLLILRRQRVRHA